MVQYGRSTMLAISFYITRYAHGVDTTCTWINTTVTYCGTCFIECCLLIRDSMIIN